MLSRVEALRNRRNNYNLEIVIVIKHLEMLKESHIVCRKDSDMTVTECNIQSSSKKNDTNDVTLVFDDVNRNWKMVLGTINTDSTKSNELWWMHENELIHGKA